MNGAHDHARWRDDVAAYAIGALDADDATAFATHLATCDRCRAELHRLAPAVGLLPGAVEQLEPPPTLRRRIMAAVESDAAPAPAPAPMRDAHAPVPPPPGLRPGRWTRRRAAVLAGTTAAVAAAFAIGVLVGGAGESRSSPTTVAVRAAAPATPRDAQAALVHDGAGWRLDVTRLPSLPAGRVYQVWVAHDRKLEPSTVFVLASDGTATVAVPQGLGHGDQLLVTREPSGGSARPTTRPLLHALV